MTGGAFFDADGTTTTPDGTLDISTDGFVCNGGPPCSNVLSLTTSVELHGSMSADKQIIVGVWSRNDGVNPHTALFAWVKRAPPVVAFSAATYTELEANTSVTITVERSGDTTTPVTVDYATVPGTTVGVPATAGVDYITTSGTLTFGAGETTKTFTVTILDDSEVEPPERVTLLLSNPTNGAVLGSLETAVVRITNDDSVVQLSAAAIDVAESAGTTSVVVTRAGYTNSAASLTYTITAGSAAAGADFIAATGTLSLPARAAVASIPLTIIQDTLADGAETLHIALSAPVGDITLGSIAATVVTIVDDDVAGALAFSASTYTATEGGAAAVITVVRNGGSASGVTVRYATSNGSALAGADYTTRTGTLTFAAGQMSRTFMVPILDDTVVEDTQTVNLKLTNAAGGASLGAPDSATLRILDNESIVQFTAAAYTRAEGVGATSVDVTRTGYSGNAATVAYTVTSSTATAGLDYTAAASGVLSFPAGVTRVPLPLTILQDTLADGPETIRLVLSAPTGNMQLGANASAVLTITDDDVAGAVAFSSETYTRTEGAGAAVITVVRNGGAASGVTVRYATRNGSALAGGNPVHARLGQTEREVVIKDNDFGGTVQFNAANYSVSEGGERTIIVTRTGSTDTELTVHYFTSDGTGVAGENYVSASGNLFFAVGQTRRTFTVRSLTDESIGNRTVNLHLTVPPGAATLGPRANALLNILDGFGL